VRSNVGECLVLIPVEGSQANHQYFDVEMILERAGQKLGEPSWISSV